MDKLQMITEIKKYGYTNIKVKGGTVPLEQAPIGNVYFMFKRVTGKLKGKITIGRV